MRVAWAGLAPDLDGLTLLTGIEAYGRWHHVLTPGLAAAVVATLRRRFGRASAPASPRAVA